MLEPCLSGVFQVQGEVADDHQVVGRTAQLASEAIVVEPERGVRLSRILGHGGGLSEARGNGAVRIFQLNTRVPGGSGDGLLSSLLS